MSIIEGNKVLDPTTHFREGMKDFFRVDKVRFINIVGSIQYGILYSILYLFIGICLHMIFPKLVKGIALSTLFMWIVLQCVIIILITFYSQKLVESIPGLLSFFPGYFQFDKLVTQNFKPYSVQEYRGDMASSIVLIGTQFQLLEKIHYFTIEFAKQYM